MNSPIGVISLPTTVMFPHAVLPLNVRDSEDIKLVHNAYELVQPLSIALMKSGWQLKKSPEPHEVICLCEVMTCSLLADGSTNALLKGTGRAFFVSTQADDLRPSQVSIAKLEEYFPAQGTVEERILRDEIDELIAVITPHFSTTSFIEMDRMNSESLSMRSNLLASILPIPSQLKQTLLAENNIGRRCRLLLNWVDDYKNQGLRPIIHQVDFSLN